MNELLFALLLVAVLFLVALIALVELNDHRKRDLARLRREVAAVRRQLIQHLDP